MDISPEVKIANTEVQQHDSATIRECEVHSVFSESCVTIVDQLSEENLELASKLLVI